MPRSRSSLVARRAAGALAALWAAGTLAACEGPLEQAQREARESAPVAQGPRPVMPGVPPYDNPVRLPDPRDPRDPSPPPIGPSPDPNPGGDYGFPRVFDCSDSTAC